MKIDKPFDDRHPRTFRFSTAKTTDDIHIVEIGHCRVPAGLKQTVMREVYTIRYVANGKGRFNGVPFDRTCGYISYPYELECMESDQNAPYEGYWIMLRGNVKALLNACGFPEHSSVFSCSLTNECAKILHRVLYETEVQDDYAEEAMMLSAFYSILALHMEKNHTGEKAKNLADRTKSLIDDNYYTPLRIDALAKQYGVTRNHLCFLFKKAHGMSPQEYLLNLRINKAKVLLSDQEKNLSISEIAFTVGFQDPLYFSRLFRKKAGTSPTEFRISKRGFSS